MKLKVIFAVLIVVFFFTSVYAIQLDVESKSVEKNSEFSLDINLTSADEIFAGQIDITFNPTILDFVRMEKGNYFGASSLDSSDFGGMVESNGVIKDYIAMRNLGETTGLARTGVFARVVFRAKEVGTSTVSITKTIWGNASANQIVDLSQVINNGQVVVTAAPVCGDGACTGSETCSTCSGDCGVCNPGGGNNPGGNNNPGGSPGGGNPPDDNSILDDILNLFTRSGNNTDGNSTCTSNWQCGDWSECIDNSQARTCADANGCAVEEVETQNCGDGDVGVDIVAAGVISVASFIGIVVFIVLYVKKKHGVILKREQLLESASPMRAQWK